MFALPRICVLDVGRGEIYIYIYTYIYIYSYISQILAVKWGFQPRNHNKQKCKLFPNNNHVSFLVLFIPVLPCDEYSFHPGPSQSEVHLDLLLSPADPWGCATRGLASQVCKQRWLKLITQSLRDQPTCRMLSCLKIAASAKLWCPLRFLWVVLGRADFFVFFAKRKPRMTLCFSQTPVYQCPLDMPSGSSCGSYATRARRDVFRGCRETRPNVGVSFKPPQVLVDQGWRHSSSAFLEQRDPLQSLLGNHKRVGPIHTQGTLPLHK